MTKKELLRAIKAIKDANDVFWKAAEPLIQAYEKWGLSGATNMQSITTGPSEWMKM